MDGCPSWTPLLFFVFYSKKFAMIRMTNCCDHWPHLFPVSKERRKEFLMESIRKHQRCRTSQIISDLIPRNSSSPACWCVQPLNCSILLDYHRLAWRSDSHQTDTPTTALLLSACPLCPTIMWHVSCRDWPLSIVGYKWNLLCPKWSANQLDIERESRDKMCSSVVACVSVTSPQHHQLHMHRWIHDLSFFTLVSVYPF